MPIVKIRMNRQVTIPKEVFDDLGLREGDFVEVLRSEDHILVKPKRLVDPDEVLTREEDALVEKGFRQLQRGEHVAWEDLKRDVDL
jgi:AbrB family looped-hinge helix DNA binding protein